MTQNSNIFLYIGKQVKDEYGRVIGKVASLAVTPNGKVNSAYVEQGNGCFVKHSFESLKFEDSEVILISEMRMGAATLCDQIPLIWRKDQALKELVDKKKISSEVYDDLHNNFEGALNQLKSEAQALAEKIDKEIAKCVQEIKELNYALVHLEIEHEIGKIDEQSYEMSFSTIQECLKKANVQKGDLEAMRNKLSNILLGEKPPEIAEETKEETPSPPSPSLPEPPVVVYVKEMGESST